VAKLAESVEAIPYSASRIRRGLGQKDMTIVPDEVNPGEAQRTRRTVTAYRGWDLPGSAAGKLEHQEETTTIDQIERSSGQALSGVRVSRDRSCQFEAPVLNGKAIFELYETLHDEQYGMLISSDRQSVSVFRFDQNRFDIELSITVDKPLSAPADTPEESGMSRIILTDGGPRFIGSVIPGVKVVNLTRAQLLAGIDRPASVTFSNMRIEPVVHRIAGLP